MTNVDAVVFPMVNRVEVIGPDGREFVRYGFDGVTINHQDGGETLKVFLRHEKEEL